MSANSTTFIKQVISNTTKFPWGILINKIENQDGESINLIKDYKKVLLEEVQK